MGNIVGAFIGSSATKSAAKTAANAQIQSAEIAAEAAKFKPWSVSSGLGTSSFDESGQVASYTLDPRIAAWRDRMYGAAEQEYTNAPGQALATSMRDFGSGLFGRAIGMDPAQGARDYYTQMQGIMAPNRALESSRLNDVMFGKGRFGYGTGVEGGYINPQQFAMQKARAEQDQELALMSTDKFRAQQLQDIDTALSMYGSGEEMRLAPYDVAGKLFGTGLGYEQLGMDPLKLGVEIGGRQATAGGNAGAFLAGGLGAAGAYKAAGNLATGQAWQKAFSSPELQDAMGSAWTSAKDWWNTPTSAPSSYASGYQDYAPMNTNIGFGGYQADANMGGGTIGPSW